MMVVSVGSHAVFVTVTSFCFMLENRCVFVLSNMRTIDFVNIFCHTFDA